ncbi:MAG: hypothetical protein QXP59_07355 [Saccharolobus sp.]
MPANMQVVKLYKNEFLDLINKIEENEKELQKIINAKITLYESENGDDKQNDIRKEVLMQLQEIKIETKVMLDCISRFRDEAEGFYVYNFYINFLVTYSSYAIYRELTSDEDQELMDAIYNKLQLLIDFFKLYAPYFLKLNDVESNYVYKKINARLARMKKRSDKILYRIDKLIILLIRSENTDNNLNLVYANLLRKAQAVVKQKIEQFDKKEIKEIKDIVEYLFEFSRYIFLIEDITDCITEINEQKFSKKIIKLAKLVNDYVNYYFDKEIENLISTFM